jgi:hypothetical protein
VERIETVNDFFCFLGNHFIQPEQQSIIFRGHILTEYKLLPGVGRVKDANNNNFSIEEERKMINSYIKKANEYLKTEYSSVESMTVAQHYGLPTRILDWTWNPLVAFFFAIGKKDEDYEKDGKVFFCDSNKFGFKNRHDRISEDFDPFDLEDEIIIYEPKFIDSRITAQSGLFSIHKNPNCPFEDERIHNIVISSTVKDDLGKVLEKMGIHSANLFPGLAGTSEHIKWLYTY